MSAKSVAAALARLTERLPGGGESRPGQTQMADAVATAIERRRPLVVQAGTGTGKSLGYLVPALVSGKRVVVATATKALQDQLAGKDLPFLQEHLGVPFEFALLKGRSNYFCWQRARELAEDRQLALDGVEGRAAEQATEQIAQIITWAGTSESGDRAELSFEPTPAAWSAVSVSAAECPGAAKCPSGESCFAELARKRAAGAEVIVVNTHLYGQHIRSGGFVLPEHDVVVLDECHEVEDIMADCLGLEVSAGRFSFLAGRARAVITDLDDSVDLRSAGELLEAVITPFTGKRLAGGPGANADLSRALTIGIERVNGALTALRKIPDDAAGGTGPKKVRAVQAATGLLTELQSAAALGTSPEVDETRVAWIEAGTGGRGPVLRIAPVEVGPALADTWAQTTAILTSATVPPNLRERLGLPQESTDTLDVGSPFDYATQALLYCAVSLPDPRNPRYEAAMHEELAALIAAAGGRTLALFTSWKAMRAAAEHVRADIRLDCRILTQADLPKPALSRAFATDETSCLFATMGFWQGIDVPGRALSLVVIDKLPFSRPDDPLLDARRERAGAKAFELIDLPRAATLLAQGAGRLIRSSHDRGVVAVLDPRLNTARYRWQLIRALPAMRRTRQRSEVEAFLAEILATG